MPQNETPDYVDAVIDEYAVKAPENFINAALRETQSTVQPFASPPTQFVPTILVPFEQTAPDQSVNVKPSAQQLVCQLRKKYIAHKKWALN